MVGGHALDPVDEARLCGFFKALLGAGGLQTRAYTARSTVPALQAEVAEAWPGDVAREALIERAFRQRQPEDTHRARPPVDIDGLAVWWTTHTPGQAEPGGRIDFRFQDPAGHEIGGFAMRVLELTPAQRRRRP